MHNIRPEYGNDWLNMLDSVEFNLKYQQQYRQFLHNKNKGYFQQNDWIDHGRIVDKVLPALTAGEALWQKRGNNGSQSGYGQRILAVFRTLHPSRLSRVSGPKYRKIYQEYQQQEEYITPTLARIHRRVKAQREAMGIKSECILTEDETLDIALRAILKIRNRN